MVCKLKSLSIALKEASRQLLLRFDHVVTSSSFKENVVDQCIFQGQWE